MVLGNGLNAPRVGDASRDLVAVGHDPDFRWRRASELIGEHEQATSTKPVGEPLLFFPGETEKNMLSLVKSYQSTGCENPRQNSSVRGEHHLLAKQPPRSINKAPTKFSRGCLSCPAVPHS